MSSHPIGDVTNDNDDVIPDAPPAHDSEGYNLLQALNFGFEAELVMRVAQSFSHPIGDVTNDYDDVIPDAPPAHNLEGYILVQALNFGFEAELVMRVAQRKKRRDGHGYLLLEQFVADLQVEEASVQQIENPSDGGQIQSTTEQDGLQSTEPGITCEELLWNNLITSTLAVVFAILLLMFMHKD